MRFSRLSATVPALVLAALCAAAPLLSAQQPAADPLHGWGQGNDPAAFEVWITQRLADAQAAIESK